MTDTLESRGPDGRGAWSQGAVALGHRRLKIIDLSEWGSQPMTDAQLGLTAVFNGCVYNYRELRDRLEGLGHRFFSRSDTEVVVKAYAEWGWECVESLIGMFAFAVVEHHTGRVVIGRDRLGIKPLYITQDSDRLRFASSLPALLAGGGVDTSLDPVALHQYLSWHGTVPAPRTVLNGVRKLPRPPSASSSGTVRIVTTATGSRRTPGTPSSARTPRSGRRRCTTRCARRCGGARSRTSPWVCSCRAGWTPA